MYLKFPSCLDSKLEVNLPCGRPGLLYQNSQYHGCCWPGDAKSLGISSHGINLSIYSSFMCNHKIFLASRYVLWWRKRWKSSSQHISSQLCQQWTSTPNSILISNFDPLRHHQINGLVQDCSNSSVLAMELLQSCTKPSKYACETYWKN